MRVIYELGTLQCVMEVWMEMNEVSICGDDDNDLPYAW